MPADRMSAPDVVALETGWVPMTEFPAKLRLLSAMAPAGEVTITCDRATSLAMARALEEGWAARSARTNLAAREMVRAATADAVSDAVNFLMVALAAAAAFTAVVIALALWLLT